MVTILKKHKIGKNVFIKNFLGILEKDPSFFLGKKFGYSFNRFPREPGDSIIAGVVLKTRVENSYINLVLRALDKSNNIMFEKMVSFNLKKSILSLSIKEIVLKDMKKRLKIFL